MSEPKLEDFLSRELAACPLLDRLSDLAYEQAGVRLATVFPHGDAWQTIIAGTTPDRPRFCQMVQSVPEGEKHCRMCHVLMTVAASSQDELTVQRCHAGANVLVIPVISESGTSIAVLTTCVFVSGKGTRKLAGAKKLAKTLGLNDTQLKKSYAELPELSKEKLMAARTFVQVAALAVEELLLRYRVERDMATLRSQRRAKKSIRDAVEDEMERISADLRQSQSELPRGKKTSRAARTKVPPIVEITSDLVMRQPNMPYTVAEIAGAAGITANHFSTLFHQHTGESFSDFLADRRIALAKKLLCDLSLNIADVARRSGFDDPGYFARRFRQLTGMSPRQWRTRALALRRARALRP